MGIKYSPLKIWRKYANKVHVGVILRRLESCSRFLGGFLLVSFWFSFTLKMLSSNSSHEQISLVKSFL